MSVIGIIVFFIGWIYAVGNFGFFLGLGLGWIPAIFVALIIDTVLITGLGLTAVAFKGLRNRDY